MKTGYYVTNAKVIMEDSHEGGTTGVVLYQAKDETDARRWATENGVGLGSNMVRGEEGRVAYESWLRSQSATPVRSRRK